MYGAPRKISACELRVLMLGEGWEPSGTTTAAVLYADMLTRAGAGVVFGVPSGRQAGALPDRFARIPLTPDWLHSSEAREFGVIHIHRAGSENRFWRELQSALAGLGVPIVETDVFGGIDGSAFNDLISVHCHVSKTSWNKARMAAEEMGYSRFRSHQVIYNPVSIPSTLIDAEEARSRLGIETADPVLCRLGRPDIRKWSDLLLRGLGILRQRGVRFLALLQGVPRSRERHIARNRKLRDCVRCLPFSRDREEVEATFAASDIHAHSSRIGESFGYTLAESGLHCLPTVVDSTPWADNAQVELVDHGVTGFVAGTAEGWAEGVARLCEDAQLRVRMGKAARQKIAEHYNSKRVVDSLLRTYEAVLAGAKDFPVYGVCPGREELDNWPEELARREADVLGGAPQRAVTGRLGYGWRDVGWFLRDFPELARRRIWGM